MTELWSRLSSVLERMGRQGRLLIFAILLVPLLFVSVYSALSSWKDLTKSTLARRQSIAELAALVLAEKFDGLTDLAISFSTRVKFRELIAEGHWAEAIVILDDVPKLYPDINRVFLADTNGNLMAETPAGGGTIGMNFSYRDWYHGVTQSWRPYISHMYERAAHPKYNIIAVAAPIVRGADQVVGILVMQVRVSSVARWMDRLETDATRIYMVDRLGQAVGHHGHSDQEIVSYTNVPVVQSVLRGEKGVAIGLNPVENERRISAHVPLSNNEWGVIAYEPTATAFAARTRGMARIVAAHLMIFLLMCLLSYCVWRVMEESRLRLEESVSLQREIEVRAHELEEANKELESYSYSVSHDLRNPLQIILGLTEALETDHRHQLNREGLGIISDIKRSVLKMAKLIEDLLEFSRQGRNPVHFTDVDMGHLVKEIIDSIRKEANGRAIHFNVEPLPIAVGDRPMLELVMQNLILNAVKFTRRQKEALIEIRGVDRGNEVIYQVSDNGEGFDMKYVQKLFTVFQRLHPCSEFEGSGIGLSIVARIIQRHGGRVWAEGRPGQGATFYFCLPAKHP